jgi:hypothetical protein
VILRIDYLYTAVRATVPASPAADTMAPVPEQTSQPLEQQLEEIGAQLAWVRDYL